MLILLSPAKTLVLNAPRCNELASLPQYMNEADELMTVLKSYTPSDLMKSMKLSEDLAGKVAGWHASWTTHTSVGAAVKSKAEACAFAMKGEAFKFLDAPSLSNDDLQYAQKNLIVLSGLYGMLRPCDLIMPYRLEMGQTFKVSQVHKSLNSFWSSVYLQAFSKKLKDHESKVILNLASDEYSKVIIKSGVDAEIITCSFKEEGENGFRTVSTFAKQARGEMARFAIQNKIENVEKLKLFNNLRYTFNCDLSDSKNFIFTRPLINK
ncbi:MAG: YaaA family protein [Flavobacteriales bacterium]|nr:YaaA family protein [Flavobacteriales bacterium]